MKELTGRLLRRLGLALAPLTLLTALTPAEAEACGCTSPPVGDVAVNQLAEQIIFEVEDGEVTAHVLIRYEGDPAEFAWIVPVPAVPSLDLSETMAFALLYDATGPILNIQSEDLCPDNEYTCKYHASCPSGGSGGSSGTSSGGGWGTDSATTTGGGTSGGGEPPGVDVLDKQVIGAYETVTFAADEADLAVQWLQDNGFVVNDSMTPYMQPYIDEGMVFVAAKLVAGSGADEIRPLKITYDGTDPMIPLRLTAVAAEPHMAVTAMIYGDSYYAPMGHETVAVGEVTADSWGRTSYPMALSRAVDSVGGDGFVYEYAGNSFVPNLGTGSCCGDASDFCGIGGDSICQCPQDSWDADDCNAEFPGLIDGLAMLEDLDQRHPRMTRLTTRMSAEEMKFDPTFTASVGDPGLGGAVVVSGKQHFLSSCEGDIIDTEAYAQIQDTRDCATVYCGAGRCAATDDGAGCLCDGGHVARVFTDLDGDPSVTCVPEDGPVDFGAGVLTDPCVGVNCGDGQCVDVGGFPHCACNGGAAAVAPAVGNVARCELVTTVLDSPGAQDYSEGLKDVKVCSPKPPSCGASGWLVPNPSVAISGEPCEGSIPAPADLIPPPEPDCGPGTGASGGDGDSGATAGSGGTGGSDGESDGFGAMDGSVAACACTADRQVPSSAWLLALLPAIRRRRRSRAG